MLRRLTPLIVFFLAAIGASALAETSDNFRDPDRGPRAELPPYLQCVPYARQLSGIGIYGDAHTWWDQAAGKYARGSTPKVGAVMAFVPHRNMRLGHVAAVSKVIDSRTVLLDHANWSPINGRRGQIERDVKAVDVSPGNDWSEVRVWYDPIEGLGKTAWPVHGFIYGERSRIERPQIALSPVRAAPVRPAAVRQKSSPEFLQAFAAPATTSPLRPRPLPATVQRTRAEPVRSVTRPAARTASRSIDPLEAAVLRYDN